MTPTPTAGPRRGEPRLGPVTNDVPLELSERPEDVEDQLAAAGGGVDLLGQAAKSDPPFVECISARAARGTVVSQSSPVQQTLPAPP